MTNINFGKGQINNLSTYFGTHIKNNKSSSSAPQITATENKVYEETKRLEKFPVSTVGELEQKGFRPKINKDGLFVTMNVPYSGVIKNKDGALVEYKDGKPVTIVKDVANGNYIEKRLIKYEYPQGSIAALKTEYSVLNEYNHKLGHSLSVPTFIQEEAGLNI